MRSFLFQAIRGLLLGTLFFNSLAYADTTFVVTRVDDPTPGPCDQGDCSLREAVIAANATGGHDTVQLSTDTYNLTRPEDGSEMGGSIDIDDDMTLQGNGAGATIINGVQPGLNSRIIDVGFNLSTLIIDGVTVQNGRAGVASPGGGILTTDTTTNFTLSNCRLTGNSANRGGGMQSNSITTIRNCRFDNNEVNGTDAAGAGVEFSSSGGLTVENCIFENNRVATAGEGGAGLHFGGGASLNISGSRFQSNKLLVNGLGAGLLCEGSNPVTITDTFFTGNSISGGAGAGGGISCSPSEIFLTSVTVVGNTTDGGDYAGIQINGGSLASIQNSVIRGNRITASPGRFPAGFFGTSSVEFLNATVSGNRNEGTGDGGGIWAVGDLIIEGSTFSGNFTNGSMGAVNLGAASVAITNSTFANNEAGIDGGALFLNTGNGSLNNVTISGNTTLGSGGGVFFDNFSTFTIHNSIISGNDDDGSGPDCRSTVEVASLGYNLFGTGTGCQLAPPEGDPASTDSYGVDPLLAALADNGGPTETLALLAGSPAIDGGDPAGCTDEDGDPLTIDQRGAVRPFGERCDIGAFEFGASPPAPPGTSNLAITKTVDDDEVSLDEDVTFTLTVVNQGPADNTNVVVTDSLPAGFLLISATASGGATCMTAGETATCTAATMANGTTFTVTLVATAMEAGEWVNTARVSGDVEDLDPANDESSVTVTILEGDGGCALHVGSASNTVLSLAWAALLVGAWLLTRHRLAK